MTRSQQIAQEMLAAAGGDFNAARVVARARRDAVSHWRKGWWVRVLRWLDALERAA